MASLKAASIAEKRAQGAVRRRFAVRDACLSCRQRLVRPAWAAYDVRHDAHAPASRRATGGPGRRRDRGGQFRFGFGRPDRRRRQRAHRLGARREDLHARERRQYEAAVEAEAREHAARDAQPLRAARRRAGRRPRRASRELAVVAGVSDDLFGIDVATGKQIWHRKFDSTLANPGGTERHALSRRPDSGADDGADVARASTRCTPCRGMAGCAR